MLVNHHRLCRLVRRFGCHVELALIIDLTQQIELAWAHCVNAKVWGDIRVSGGAPNLQTTVRSTMAEGATTRLSKVIL